MKISIFIADEGYGHAMRQKNIIHELLDHIPFVHITVYGKDKLDLISDEFKDALKYVDIGFFEFHATKIKDMSIEEDFNLLRMFKPSLFLSILKFEQTAIGLIPLLTPSVGMALIIFFELSN